MKKLIDRCVTLIDINTEPQVKALWISLGRIAAQIQPEKNEQYTEIFCIFFRFKVENTVSECNAECKCKIKQCIGIEKESDKADKTRMDSSFLFLVISASRYARKEPLRKIFISQKAGEYV